MIVMDCSAAVEIVNGTAKGKAFRTLMLDGEKIIASELFRAEIFNAFWKYVRAGLMETEQAKTFATKAIELVDEFVPLEENASESFSEAVRQNHSVYDMFYLTLARRNDATLFTADRKLMKICDEMGVDCVQEVEI